MPSQLDALLHESSRRDNLVKDFQIQITITDLKKTFGESMTLAQVLEIISEKVEKESRELGVGEEALKILLARQKRER